MKHPKEKIIGTSKSYYDIGGSETDSNQTNIRCFATMQLARKLGREQKDSRIAGLLSA
jgi:hypothetical protein